MQCATAFNAGTDDDDDVFFFVHLFAIFIVLVLSYCCFLLLFYDRVWNGTFTTFSIITLRCFNEYWARGCRDDANRLSASAVSASHNAHRDKLTFFSFFLPSLTFSFSHGALLSRRRRHRCRFSRQRVCVWGYLLLAAPWTHAHKHICTFMKSSQRNVRTMMGVS